MSVVYSPNKVFVSTKDGVVPVESLFVARAVSANNSVVAAVSGKRIRVVGLTIQTNGAAAGSITFYSGSGGTALWGFVTPPNTMPPFVHEPNLLGYFETATGVGLFDTVVTTAQVYTIQYIIYTP